MKLQPQPPPGVAWWQWKKVDHHVCENIGQGTFGHEFASRSRQQGAGSRCPRPRSPLQPSPSASSPCNILSLTCCSLRRPALIASSAHAGCPVKHTGDPLTIHIVLYCFGPTSMCAPIHQTRIPKELSHTSGGSKESMAIWDARPSQGRGLPREGKETHQNIIPVPP